MKPVSRQSRLPVAIAMTMAVAVVAGESVVVHASNDGLSECPPDGTVQHWSKVNFRIKADTERLLPREIRRTELELRYPSAPGQVMSVKQVITSHLAEQFQVPELEPDDLNIVIEDVSYQAITCGIAGPVGPTGPRGEQGPTGPAPTLRTYQRIEADSASAIATCDPGDVATGGGGFTVGGTLSALEYRSGSPPGGSLVAALVNGSAGSADVFSIVVCLDVTP